MVAAGGQGLVLRAHDHHHGRTVALKVRETGSASDRTTLLAEARTLLAVTPHPGMAVVRDDFFDGDRHYMVLDWVDGRDLRRLLAQEGNPGLPFATVLAVVEQAAAALDHLHEHRPPVIHGDVKPANLVLTDEGRVVLVDFGLAGPLSRGRTEGYAAPEVAAGGRPTRAADVFSLAATAVALLTGRPPRLGTRPEWPGLDSPEGRRVERALGRGLAIDPDHRPATAGALVAGLRDAGPPVVPHNLPAPLDEFVGRRRERALVHRRLARHRLVTIVGPGGVGKTRLAVEVASAGRREHPDGVWLVELATATEPGDVVGVLARAVGARADGALTLADAVRRRLAGEQVLLVMDNAEHVRDTAAELVLDLLQQCPELTVLTTSREALRAPGENVIELEPLSIAGLDTVTDRRSAAGTDAVRLFVRRAAAARVGFRLDDANAPLVAGMCRQLDGLPLAIELVAAELARHDCGDVAAMLATRFGALDTRDRAGVPRHRTLRTAIGWSYERLAPPLQSRFRRLSVFAGGFTEAAADSVAGPIGPLVGASLVSRANAGRYRMLEPVRQYAYERLDGEDDAPAAWRALTSWCLELVADADVKVCGPEQAAFAADLDAEHANLIGALAWCLDGNDQRRGLELAAALGEYWWNRGHTEDGVRWLDPALAAAPVQPSATLVRALNARGILANVQGDRSLAAGLHDRARVAAEAIGDDKGLARALRGVAWAGDAHTAPAAVLDLYTRSLCLAARSDDVDDRAMTAGVLGNVGSVHLLRGDADAAAQCFAESLAIRRAIGDTGGTATALLEGATLVRMGGDVSGARDSVREAVAILRELADLPRLAMALKQLSGLLVKEGDVARARSAMEEAVAIERRVGTRRGLASSRSQLGIIALAEGDVDEALAHQREALTDFVDLGDDNAVAQLLTEIAYLLARRGDPETGARVLGAADTLRPVDQRGEYPDGAARRRRQEDAMREALGDGAFAAAVTAGRGWSRDHALAVASRSSGRLV